MLGIKEIFKGSANTTYTFQSPMIAFAITNDGDTDLSFAINSVDIVVKPGNMFNSKFKEPFTGVAITATSPFRAYGLNAITTGNEDREPDINLL